MKSVLRILGIAFCIVLLMVGIMLNGSLLGAPALAAPIGSPLAPHVGTDPVLFIVLKLFWFL